jgi:hypothetical protein
VLVVTERVKGSLVPLAFDAMTTALVEPGAVGVPEMRPVLEFILSPAGSSVAENWIGLFVADS